MCRQSLFPADEDPLCMCRQAVERAYKTLVGAGHPESMALDAAKRVYRHHHPEDSREMANLTVERWVASRIH
jgi:hypothetical protein